MENKKEGRKREMFLVDYVVSVVSCSFLLFFSASPINNAVPAVEASMPIVFPFAMRRKGPLTILAAGLVGKKKRRGSCFHVASLANGEYLFILSRTIFIAILNI